MCNSDMQMILKIVVEVLDVIHFFVPIVLILFCTIDIFRPVLIDHNYPYFYEAFVIFDKTLSNQFSVLLLYFLYLI